MKLENKHFYILIVCALLLFTYSSKAQSFEELEIKDKSTSFDLPLELIQFDIYGHFNYSLYGYRKNESENSWIFKTLCAESGNMEVLNIDSKYSPISFINNDTLLVKNLDNHKFSGIRMSDKKICVVDKKLFDALENNSYQPSIHRIKINRSYLCAAILNKQNLELNVFKYTNGIRREINLTSFLKEWKCTDFFWVDNDHLLITLTKSNRKGNDLEYRQKIYNILTNTIEDIQLTKRTNQIEDYNNGFCIIRTLKSKPPFIIYEVKTKGNELKFSKIASINVKSEDLLYIGNLEFISTNKIIRTNNTIGDKGVLVLNFNSNDVNLNISKW